ncbi:alpha/beta fold hydrolase [Salinibacterium sp. ZJ77]|uniref:alpha/beta fold hydrolase n=1 Tax=Salinibacterium sp. ZJ77 TaxID=2708337 RepID=UPI00141D809C|nr:alpha/beta fold hydrolase [Salinibacterium sp. ZJ77]
MTPRTLPRPGATLAFDDLPGEKRAFVLVHGAGLTREMWAPQARALNEAGHRVINLDLRGHGESTLETTFTADDAIDDLIELLEQLQLDSPVLVGHSLGGNLAQSAVSEWPDLVGHFVAVDCTWNTGPLSEFEQFGLDISVPMLRAIPARRLPRMMARACSTHPAAIDELERMFAQMPKPRFLEVWGAAVSLVAPDPDYRTPVPLTLIMGAHDKTGNIRRAMPAWAKAEDIEVVRIPAAGHVPSLDNPDAMTEALLNAAAG